MLELLATVDPFAAVLTGLWLFAAGMFPVGFMLGSTCSACCLGPCDQCTEGELPDTLTVTFSGLADKTPGPDLISLAFSACYGSGAAAKVTAPAGDPATDKGPISAISLTSGGSGYAQLGRVAPTLTVSGGSGTGATFTPTLSTSKDACKLDLWALASVAASGGTGYADGDTLTITFADGDTEAAAAQATLYLGKAEPTITLDGTATATIGLGVTVTPTWVVNDVTVTNGGTGYSEGGAVTFSAGVNDVTISAATGIARVVHDAPQNAVLTIDTAGGVGAVLTPVWTLLPSNQWPAPHKKTYKLQSVTVVNGGSGYANYELISISFASPDDGTVNQAAYIDCDVVGVGGVIQSVYIAAPNDIFTPTPAGRYVGSRTDALHSVEITNAGEYYEDDPGARYVVVDNGGSYYREDASEPPYVATVTVTVTDTAPSSGSGAVLSVTIDDDTGSATFGQITAVTIDGGGDGYLAHEMFDTCLSRFDGRSIVVKRSAGSPCVYSFSCVQTNCSLELEQVHVTYNGASSPLTIEASVGLFSSPPVGAAASMTADVLSPDCSNIDATATGGTIVGGGDLPSGATAHVVAGGEYQETETCKKILLEDYESMTVDIQWNGYSWTAATNGNGVPPACNTGPRDTDFNASVVAVSLCGLAAGFNVFAAFNCDGYGAVGFDMGIVRKGCGWHWGYPTIGGPQSGSAYYVGPGKYCAFKYQIVGYELDGDGFPTGAAEIASYGLWEGGSTNCSDPDPGPPSITFSRLP